MHHCNLLTWILNTPKNHSLVFLDSCCGLIFVCLSNSFFNIWEVGLQIDPGVTHYFGNLHLLDNAIHQSCSKINCQPLHHLIPSPAWEVSLRTILLRQIAVQHPQLVGCIPIVSHGLTMVGRVRESLGFTQGRCFLVLFRLGFLGSFRLGVLGLKGYVGFIQGWLKVYLWVI